ncbi:MAG: LysR family transcriptional regulator [Gemmataceae bacterium]|nr:LysR family transcriptional regulator [Gemmataceae bacterium]
MQIEALKVFCDVARLRSFSQAAQTQSRPITQSAASQVVSQLEERLGVQLIDRSTRPLQLTPLGQTYYEGCRQILDQYAELEASIRTANAHLAGTVRVAAIYSVGLGDISQYVQRFKADYPDVAVHLEYLHPDRVYEKVRDGAADLGLVSFPRRSPRLASQPWREEEMVLTCSPVHPLAAGRDIRPAQFGGEAYIHFDRGLTIRREVDRFLREQGVAVEVVLEFDNIENIKKAVELGAGVALLPEPTVRREVEDGTLLARPLQGCRLVRPLGIIHRRHHKLSASARRFMELLRQYPTGGLLDTTSSGAMPTGAAAETAGKSRTDANHRVRHDPPATRTTANGTAAAPVGAAATANGAAVHAPRDGAPSPHPRRARPPHRTTGSPRKDTQR